MADKVIASRSKIVAIADAIRTKTDSTDTYTLDEMPDAIANMSTGLISQIKVEDGTITDVIRDMTITGNQLRVVDTDKIGIGINSSLAGDRNGLMSCNVSQMRNVPYCIEVDVDSYDISTVSFGTSSGNNYFSLFTFGYNKSTLYGVYFNVETTSGEITNSTLNVRANTSYITSDEYYPSDLNGKTVKLYCNCNLSDGKVIHENGHFLLYIDDDLILDGDFSNNAGTGWDQMCNIGWSSYSWGAYMLKISEYRCTVLG